VSRRAATRPAAPITAAQTVPGRHRPAPPRPARGVARPTARSTWLRDRAYVQVH